MSVDYKVLTHGTNVRFIVFMMGRQYDCGVLSTKPRTWDHSTVNDLATRAQ